MTIARAALQLGGRGQSLAKVVQHFINLAIYCQIVYLHPFRSRKLERWKSEQGP